MKRRPDRLYPQLNSQAFVADVYLYLIFDRKFLAGYENWFLLHVWAALKTAVRRHFGLNAGGLLADFFAWDKIPPAIGSKLRVSESNEATACLVFGPLRNSPKTRTASMAEQNRQYATFHAPPLLVSVFPASSACRPWWFWFLRLDP